MSVEDSQKKRYWLLTSPRTASNLLIRILNLDAQGVPAARLGGYFFFPNALTRVKMCVRPVSEWTPEEYAEVNEAAKGCFRALQNHVEAAEAAGHKVFIKEHIGFICSVYSDAEVFNGGPVENARPPGSIEPMHGLTTATQSALNFTCLPDEFLKTWHPTFLIRHPAMQLPSNYRTALTEVKMDGVGRHKPELYETEGTLKFVRGLHDFYVNHFGKDSIWPLVLDADDIIETPEIVAKYAGLVGLDASKLKLSWDKITQEKYEQLIPAEKVMLSTIHASTGIIKEKAAGNIDIDVEAVKWRAEFGEEGAKNLVRWVRQMMPDYEYLRSRRLRLDN
ncbi:hypothetical protein GGR50DRAFT_684948 [Xylaria sp. CBS 124048]|nr:hypothetical protein GGR50DRAFT_684948 [Xylaria sp. CBS 124048]